MNKIVIVSGYFNPLHIGHLELFYNAKEVGDLWVIVNNDLQRKLKVVRSFMTEDERLEIITALTVSRYSTIIYEIKDKTQCATLKYIGENYGIHINLFANGGDQNNDTIPERSTCERYGITLLEGLGNKIQSSSWLLNNK